MLGKQDFYQVNLYLMAMLGLDRLRRGDHRIRLESFKMLFSLIRKELIRLCHSLPETVYPYERRILLWLEDMLALMEYGLITTRMIQSYLNACESVQGWILAKIPLTLDYIVDLQISLIEDGFDFDFEMESQFQLEEVRHVSA